MSAWDIQHYRDALGFEETPYLRATEGSLQLSSQAPRKTLLVLSRPLQAEARELCLKMLQAMKLPETQLRHAELASGSVDRLDASLCAQTQTCIILGLDIAAEFLGMDRSPALRGPSHRLESWPLVDILVTHSPEDCLADASLKRPVWDDLQSVRQRFVPLEDS
jgi:hypothetical protein